MNFTKSLTEPLKLELFQKLPKQFLHLLNLSFGSNRDSYEKFKALLNKHTPLSCDETE